MAETIRLDVATSGDTAGLDRVAGSLEAAAAAADDLADNARQAARAVDDIGDQAAGAERAAAALERAARATPGRDARGRFVSAAGGGGDGQSTVGQVASAAGGAGLAVGPSNLTSLLSGGFSGLPPEAKAGIAAGLVAAAATAAPLMGATISAGVLAVLGGGVLAGGIAAAVKGDPSIGAAFSEVGKRAAAQLGMDAASAFRGPLLAAADTAGEAWDRVRPRMAAAFAGAAQFVGPLVTGVTQAVEILAGAAASAMARAEPVIDVLAAEVPQIAQAVSIFFAAIEDHSAGAARGIQLIMDGLEGFLVLAGLGVGYLTGLFDQFFRAASVVADVLGMDGISKALADYGAQAGNAAVQTGALSGAQGTASGTTVALSDHQMSLGRTLGENIAALGSFSAAMAAATGAAQSLEGATIAQEAAIDALSAGVQHNGTTLDVTTEKGRNNRQMFLDAARAAEAHAKAVYDDAVANGRAGTAADEAAADLNQSREAFRAAATAAGFNRAEVERLTNALFGIPNIRRTVTVEIQTIKTGDIEPRPTRGKITGFASGGRYQPGPMVVGEKGPELLFEDKPGYVMNNATASRLMAGSKGGGTLLPAGAPSVMTLLVDSAGSSLDDFIAEAMRRYVRVNGGDVQATLGSN